MTRKNIAHFDAKGFGRLTLADGSRIETTLAQCDRYIRIDDSGRHTNPQYPQLCAGGSRMGNTLIWAREWKDIPAQFARDCNARLYKTLAGYDRARARITAKQMPYNGYWLNP